MLLLKEMINSIFGTNPILFLLLQSLLTGLPLLPSMSQIILLKWGRELGASLQTFQVFHVFFHFFIRFSQIGHRNATTQARKIYQFSFSEASHGFVNWINWSSFTKVKQVKCWTAMRLIKFLGYIHPHRIQFNFLGFKNFFSVNISCIVWVRDFNFLMSAFVWQENIFFLRRLLSSWMQMFSRANIATTSLTFPQVPKTNTQRSEILHIIFKV